MIAHHVDGEQLTVHVEKAWLTLSRTEQSLQLNAWCCDPTEQNALKGCKRCVIVAPSSSCWPLATALLLCAALLERCPKLVSMDILEAGVRRGSETHTLQAFLQQVFDRRSILRPDLETLAAPLPEAAWSRVVRALGHGVVQGVRHSERGMAFLGETLTRLVACVASPRAQNFANMAYHVRAAVIGVAPLVASICFLMGMVLTFQSAHELRRFGAEIFAIDLVGIATLREVGVLLASVLLAGRSGSAFTAHIGFMKLNQEIDALRVMGMHPFDVLVIPRVLALTLAFPLVVVVGNLAALAGCAVAASTLLDLSLMTVVGQLRQALTLWTVQLGVLKAPLFAFVIGCISCYQGFQVREGALSVGRHTTRAVVSSIFWVVIADALFSVLFTILEL